VNPQREVWSECRFVSMHSAWERRRNTVGTFTLLDGLAMSMDVDALGTAFSTMALASADRHAERLGD
jgi:triphosphoribosyl-dephospho-CoA synthetase